MEHRFLRGEDKDVDYKAIDESDDYNDWSEETRRIEDEYFAGEQEEYIGDGEKSGDTGVQDF